MCLHYFHWFYLQAISRGITKAGVGVDTLNLEMATPEEISEVISKADGFTIGVSQHVALPSGCTQQLRREYPDSGTSLCAFLGLVICFDWCST